MTIAGGPLHKSLLLAITALCASIVSAQSPSPAPVQSKLSVHWEELTGDDVKDAIARAQGTCLLPFGIMEKHGPHLPLGNDLLNVRYVALNAAQQEYAVVFPEYYFGQIFEAKHEPGTVAYSRGLQLQLLQETTDEMARNGCKKVIIVNGHGGNNSLLPYFAQSQLESPHDYAGEGAAASRELGEFEAKTWISTIVQAIRAVKADSESLRLQNEFYERSKKPLETPQ